MNLCVVSMIVRAGACVCVCACVSECVRACVRACVCVCVRARARVFERAFRIFYDTILRFICTLIIFINYH